MPSVLMGCCAWLQAAWLSVLFAGYAVQRGACQLGLPADGLRRVRSAWY
jgi:hypothetical protein